MAKISQARKALAASKDARVVKSTARGDFAKAPGESDRPAVDSGVDVASIDAAFAPPAEPVKPKPVKASKVAPKASDQQ